MEDHADRVFCVSSLLLTVSYVMTVRPVGVSVCNMRMV